MKLIYITLGFLFLGLGMAGIMLPMLPGTPFLLVALFFFTKGSTRIHQWFINTAIYHNHLKSLKENRSLSFKAKRNILFFATLMMGIACYYVPSIHAKIAILVVLVVKYWFFFFYLKTENTFLHK